MLIPFLLFVLVPIAEIALFIQVGGFLGLWTTLAIVVATAALGTFLLRQQGLRTLMQARGRLGAGQLPASELVEGLIIVVGGALLLTPGFLTDSLGFCCLLPPTRRWLARALSERLSVAALGGDARGGFEPPIHGQRHSRDVIDGEWSEVDREP